MIVLALSLQYFFNQNVYREMAATVSQSEYFKALTEENRTDYIKKLTLATGESLPDPFTLQNWQTDVKLLPDITWGDIYVYLIEYPSLFSKESLKAYKSLEGYNFFVSGHVKFSIMD